MSRSLALMLTIGTIGGCAVDPSDDLGEVSVTLTGQAGSGAIYRLRNAHLALTGPVSSLAFNTEDDPARSTINARVPAGRYAKAACLYRMAAAHAPNREECEVKAALAEMRTKTTTADRRGP